MDRKAAADTVMLADGFYDRHQRYRYLLGCEIARCIRNRPSLLDEGRGHLERFCADDPQQRDGYRLWDALLHEGAEAVATALSERSPAGDYAPETASCFIALPATWRADLLETSYGLVDETVQRCRDRQALRLAREGQRLDYVRGEERHRRACADAGEAHCRGEPAGTV